MNPKAQTQFVQTLANATFIYLFYIKDTSSVKNKHCENLRNIQSYYGCLESSKNGMLHLHALLWIIHALNSNELVEKLKFDKTFKFGLLKYSDNIIIKNLDMQTTLTSNERINFD